ncbi:MscL family protein [Mycoplasmopsis cynos]|uniref:large conductance mechanosensitive channel protein MscL n=1 Tax=Mycoplasmopsis cynos TaxID=171284 RepID=UPI0030CA5C34
MKEKIIKKSFKDAFAFLKKGNMLLLAIGFLAGVVFNAVVSSLANDIIMQAIASTFGVTKLDNWVVHGMLVGKFLGTVLNFIIVTTLLFVILFFYFIIKNIVNIRRAKNKPKEELQELKPTTDELILQQLQEINKNLSKNKSKTAK